MKMNYLSDRAIVIFNRSFWPDIEATGQFLTELCERLAEQYPMLVVAGRSYYVKGESFKPGRFFNNEIYKNIRILRVRHTRFWKGNIIGRLTNWLTYSILAFMAGLRIKPRLIISCTDPPLLSIICMVLKYWHRVPLIYNIRDLYPDVAIELGKLKTGFVSRLFDYLNRKAFYSADIVVPLGSSMADRLKAKGVSEKHIRVIPDWADIRAIKPVHKKDNPLLEKLRIEHKFIIMYSGNIGLSQDFTSVLQAAFIMKERSSWCLIFVGEGGGKKPLEYEVRELGLDNVLFLPYQPLEMLAMSLSMADLHLIPLKKGMAGAIVPSKVYGIMAAGRPYLAITERESEPARLAKEFGCGLWAAPGDVKAITEAFTWALNHRDELKKMGNIARQLAETRFDKNVVIKEWVKILANLNTDGHG